MSRLRSSADGDSQMLLTCNPCPDSFICEWIEWWLDDEGYPDPEKSGIVKYYVMIGDDIKFGDSEEELKENFPEALYIPNPLTGEDVYVPPKTMTFIGGTI